MLEREDLKDKALAADICKSEDGYLYVSIRGSGGIRTFQVKDTGELEQLQVLELSEKGLRSICLDNSQKHLLVADQTKRNDTKFFKKRRWNSQKRNSVGSCTGSGKSVDCEVKKGCEKRRS